MLGNEECDAPPAVAPVVIEKDASDSSCEASDAANTDEGDAHAEESAFTQDDYFKHMKLRKIVKENHSQRISHLQLNLTSGVDSKNVLLSVGSNQASVYDNEHVGEHLDIVSNFCNENSPDVELQTLLCGTWVPSDKDAVFAVGGVDKCIHVCSVTRGEQLCELEGHKSPVVAIIANPVRRGLLLSLGRDGSGILWNVAPGCAERLVARLALTDASAAAFDTTGNTLAVGTNKGTILLFSVAALLEKAASSRDDFKASFAESSVKLHTGAIDFIKYTSDGCAVSKSAANLVLWDSNGKVVRKVTAKAASEDSQIDISFDGRYACVGSQRGTVSIVDLTSGKEVATLKHQKLKSAITACCFCSDLRQVLCATKEGYILRYDYVSPQQWAEWTKLARDLNGAE